MPRSADYTIKGFLYQFNKTALEILNAEESAVITVEGVTEDIEVVNTTSTIGIQCKYHEASNGFTPSAIYKPLLQMIADFQSRGTEDISYILFAHFPGAESTLPPVGKADCESALKSSNAALQNLIATIPDTINLDEFLAKFKMEYGPCYKDLVDRVTKALERNGLPESEIGTLTYPNLINIIAHLSTLHDPANRTITRTHLVKQLNDIRKTAISRWTLALSTKDKLLAARRKQLKSHLDKNSRLRYIVIDPKAHDDYQSEIVLFIGDYLEKYHFKPAHINTPVVCLCDTREQVQAIQHRLYQKGIIATDGYIGTQFEESYFYRSPMSNKGTGSTPKREFALRLTNWDDHGTALNSRKCDDLFIIGEPDCSWLETIDVNVEKMSGATFMEIKYMMGITNVYE